MNAGQWHRLDNVFIILVLNQVSLTMLLKLTDKQKEIFRWVVLCFTLWCQECSPWNVAFTIIPIVIPLLFNIYLHIFYPLLRPSYYFRNLHIGNTFFIIGVIFFFRGLDDENDWIRLNHGMWHLFAGFGAFFWDQAIN